MTQIGNVVDTKSFYDIWTAIKKKQKIVDTATVLSFYYYH